MIVVNIEMSGKLVLHHRGILVKRKKGI